MCNRDVVNFRLSGFSEGWSAFTQSEFDPEVFTVDIVIPTSLLFCMEESINIKFQVTILNLSGAVSKADLAAESALLFPFTAMWLRIQYIRISLEWNMNSIYSSV